MFDRDAATIVLYIQFIPKQKTSFPRWAPLDNRASVCPALWGKVADLQ